MTPELDVAAAHAMALDLAAWAAESTPERSTPTRCTTRTGTP